MARMTSVIKRYVGELQRRSVLRVAVGYAIVAWVVIQIAEATFEPLQVPDTAMTLVIVLAAIGFPVAVVLAWAFDVTPKGVERVGARDVSETEPSVAVLPFADMSAQQDQGYFCEGVAEEIIGTLVRIKGLQVASRTSTLKYAGAELDSREIGRQLGVTALLEGSVRKSDNQLRVTVELTSVADGYHLWSRQFDRDLKDIFAIQDEIATNIAEALKVTISPGERGLLRKIPTKDAQAYDYYLRGRNYYYQFRKHGMQFALEMFHRAVEIDPEYALAYAGIGDCCAYLYLFVDRSEECKQCADDASRRALELDPESALAHAVRGQVHSFSDLHKEAEREFNTAIELDPDLFEGHYYYARDSFTQGKLEQAVRHYNLASEARPEDYQSPLLSAQSYDDLGQESVAKAQRHRGVKLVEEHLKLHPDDTRALYMGANGLIGLGQRERGLRWAERAVELEPNDTMLLYNVACVYCLAGSNDKAVDYLAKAAESGVIQAAWIENDSNLNPLRDNSRFETLMSKLT